VVRLDPKSWNLVTSVCFAVVDDFFSPDFGLTG